ncbi:hypothetical protein C7S13_5378 [Burkholderia cepacia]|nr:hypothetical protein [Burkholderia cepacia]
MSGGVRRDLNGVERIVLRSGRHRMSALVHRGASRGLACGAVDDGIETIRPQRYAY